MAMSSAYRGMRLLGMGIRFMNLTVSKSAAGDMGEEFLYIKGKHSNCRSRPMGRGL
jgi:hypothetical protein